MITNCLKYKIAEGGKRKPTIFTAILNLYERGLISMSAQEVRVECENIDSTVPWGKRLAAICNTMKNAIECGGVILCEDKNNNYKISFDGKIENSFSTNVMSIHKVRKNDIIPNKLSSKLAKSTNISKNESCKALIEKLDWDKIRDKSKKKLLIIACSDTKTPSGNNVLQNNFFDNSILYNNLIKNRIEVRKMYEKLLTDEPNYFIYKGNPPKRIKRNNMDVSETYFCDCIDNNHYLPAFERYSGDFYSPEHRRLYLQKNKESNLHILIISGLYGIIEFKDSIIDYHFEMKKTKLLKKEWKTINDTITKYIETNQIPNDMVFYSLSPSSYQNVLTPINDDWKNLWITGGRLVNNKNSANCLKKFLFQL